MRGSERGAVPGVDRAGQVSSAVPRPRQQPRSGGCGWWRRRWRGGGVPQPKVWVRHVALTGASTSGPRPRAASAGPVHKTQYQQYSEQPPTSAASLLKMPARTITFKKIQKNYRSDENFKITHSHSLSNNLYILHSSNLKSYSLSIYFSNPSVFQSSNLTLLILQKGHTFQV